MRGDATKKIKIIVQAVYQACLDTFGVKEGKKVKLPAGPCKRQHQIAKLRKELSSLRRKWLEADEEWKVALNELRLELRRRLLQRCKKEAIRKKQSEKCHQRKLFFNNPFQTFWKKKQKTWIWTLAEGCFVPKELNSSTLDQFWEISLLDVKGKIFWSIIANRLTSYLLTNEYVDTGVQKRVVPGYSGCLEHTSVADDGTRFPACLHFMDDITIMTKFTGEDGYLVMAAI